MKIVHTVLLLFLVGTTQSASKIGKILKNLAKRYGTPYGAHIELNPFLADKYRQALWNELSDEEIATRKREQMETMGKWFGWQSTDGAVEREWGDKLTRLFSNSIKMRLCGTDTVLDYYQSIRYLEQNRKGYLAWGSGGVLTGYKFNLEETPREFLNFTVMFEVKSKLGSIVNMGYKITSSLNVLRIHKWCDFIIQTVEVLGDCPDQGSVQGDLLSQQELWKQDTEVQKVLRMFNRDQEVTPLHPNQIPRGWLNALEPSEKFSAMTCSAEPSSNSLTVEQFKKWYDRLDIMWHPSGNLNAQILNLKADEEMDARITMPLQIGWNESNPIHNWEFKIKAVYNTRGDNQWYITTVHALCPPGIHIVGEYRKALPALVGDNFAARVNDKVQWYSALNFLSNFLGDDYQLFVCTLDQKDKNIIEYVPTLAKLEQNLWAGQAWYRGTLARYGLEDGESVGEAPLYATDFSMHLALTKVHDPEDKYEYEGKIKFSIEYSDTDMFYYIKKVEMVCIEVYKDSVPCRHKICKPI